jgi:hypothetical protein
MKVLLHYEDEEDTTLHKSLKLYVRPAENVLPMSTPPPLSTAVPPRLLSVSHVVFLSTLPKTWKTGPTSKLLEQFVESYNGTTGKENPLAVADLHLALREETKLVALPSDAIVTERIPDRGDVYIMHGASHSLAALAAQQAEAKAALAAEKKNTVPCTHFGCKNRFPRGGPYPDCRYHKAPPVFHETAKFWSCCPNKKAYEWETFQEIPGCETGTCSEVKDDDQKLFLGGTDLREKAQVAPLKSIDDFNKAQAAGGADAAPVVERLQKALAEIGVEQELFDQVVQGIRKELEGATSSGSEAEIFEQVKGELGSQLKKAMKGIAAEQLRLK